MKSFVIINMFTKELFYRTSLEEAEVLKEKIEMELNDACIVAEIISRTEG